MNNDFGHDWLNNPLLFNMELIDDLLVEFNGISTFVDYSMPNPI